MNAPNEGCERQRRGPSHAPRRHRLATRAPTVRRNSRPAPASPGGIVPPSSPPACPKTLGSVLGALRRNPHARPRDHARALYVIELVGRMAGLLRHDEPVAELAELAESTEGRDTP